VALVGPDATCVAAQRPTDEILSTRAEFLSPLEQVALPLALRKAKIDLLHATSFSVPAAWRKPLVLTLHDLTHLEIPELRTRARVTYYRRVVGPAARRAARVLTVSQYAKNRIVEELGVPEARVVVAPNAVDLPIPPGGRREGGVPMLLAVGNGKPHKNLSLLVEMQALLTHPTRLVLAGTGLEGLAARGVEVAGVVSDAQLARLYREATLFLCPSRSEGFGLPPLEAARLGTPVVVARAGALKEIWDGAALLLAPTDAKAWARAVDGLLGDSVARDALAQRCIERSLEYGSWDRLIRAAEEAYGLTA
jgi:glycosyltransferase involved in cell wall biosynthesis